MDAINYIGFFASKNETLQRILYLVYQYRKLNYYVLQFPYAVYVLLNRPPNGVATLCTFFLNTLYVHFRLSINITSVHSNTNQIYFCSKHPTIQQHHNYNSCSDQIIKQTNEWSNEEKNSFINE
jgi:hypothetical protein